jgi:hypothetical protein
MGSFLPLDVATTKLGRSRGFVGIALAACAALIAWFLYLAPVLVAFAFVVAGAIAWCIWLERHPETH